MEMTIMVLNPALIRQNVKILSTPPDIKIQSIVCLSSFILWFLLSI